MGTYGRKIFDGHKALREFSMIKTKLPSGELVNGMTNDYTGAMLCLGIENLVKKLAKKPVGEKIFYVSKGSDVVKSSAIGQDIIVKTRMLNVLKKNYPSHRFNPYVDVFMKVFDTSRLRHISESVPKSSGLGITPQAAVDELSLAVKGLQDEVNGERFKKEISNHLRRINKNAKGLIGYIDALFKQRSRLLVLRLDLTYHQGVAIADRDSIIDYGLAKAHRIQWMREINRKFLKDSLLGYAWKMEYGLDKGYHYHFILFLDGSKNRKDISIGMALGEHWANFITKGWGLYYNCNAEKNNYSECGVGMINSDEAEKRDYLIKAALYLTKVDYYMHMLAPGGDKTFAKGNFPAEKVSKRGRPRIIRTGAQRIK